MSELVSEMVQDIIADPIASFRGVVDVSNEVLASTDTDPLMDFLDAHEEPDSEDSVIEPKDDGTFLQFIEEASDVSTAFCSRHYVPFHALLADLNTRVNSSSVAVYIVELAHKAALRVRHVHRSRILQVDISNLQYFARLIPARCSRMAWTTQVASLISALAFVHYAVPSGLFGLLLEILRMAIAAGHMPTIVILVIVVSVLYALSEYIREACYMVMMQDNRRESPTVPSEIMRGVMRSLRESRSSDRPSVSHPWTSSERNTGVDRLLILCGRLQCSPYFHLKSRRIDEMDTRGSTYTYGMGHEHNDPYVINDLSDPLDDDEVIIMVDRDYHVDMTEVLTLGLPVLLYTFEPIRPCDSTGEMTYSFDREGNLVGGVPGSESWKHKLWDYPDDKVSVCRRGVATHYKIMKWRISANSPRVIILLNPISQCLDLNDRALTRFNPVSGDAIVIRGRDTTHYSTVGSMTCWSVETSIWDTIVSEVMARSLNSNMPAISRPAITQRLRQLGLEDEDDVQAAALWATLREVSMDFWPPCHSTRFAMIIEGYTPVQQALVDKTAPEEDPVEEDKEPIPFVPVIHTRMRPIPDHDIVDNTTLTSKRPKTGPVASPKEYVWADLYPSVVPGLSEPTDINTLPLPPQVASIDAYGQGMTDSYSHGAVTLAKPLIIGGSYPAKTEQNSLQGVGWRLMVPQETSCQQTEIVDDKYFRYIKDFCGGFISQATKKGATFPLEPMDEEYVCDQQRKPSQRQQQAEAAMMPEDYTKGSDMFPKLEHGAVSSTSDSRSIVTEGPFFKTELARYTYALAEAFKLQCWYAFGQSCASVANRVANICQWCVSNGMGVAMTDYNRFDGTVNAFVRYFVATLYGQCFHVSHHAELDRLLKRRMNVEVKCKKHDKGGEMGFFFKYMSGFSLLSGDPNTSVIGSAFNAFVAYCSHRESGCTHEEAMERLGIYGGDDGVTPITDLALYRRVASDLGMNLDAQFYTRLSLNPHDPDTYVKFLSRVYSPLVWEGSPDSCCSFLRTATKFTYSTYTDKKAFRLLQKSASLLINDPNTPLLSDYAKAVTTIFSAVANEQYTVTANDCGDGIINWWGHQAVLHGGAFPNANGDGWMEDYVCGECPDLDIDNFRAEVKRAFNTTTGSIPALATVWKSNFKQRNKVLTAAFRFIAGVHTDLIVVPRVKAGQVEEIVGNGEHVVLEDNTAPNRVPLLPPANESGLVIIEPNIDGRAYEKVVAQGDYVLEGKFPLPDIPPGSRKCVLVNAHLFSAYLPSRPRRTIVIYSGAYNPLTMNTFIAMARSTYSSLWKILMIDPLFGPNSYRTAKGSKTSLHNFPLIQSRLRKILSEGNQDDPGDIVWFDDMSSGEDDYRATWDMKLQLKEMIGSRLAACSLKIRRMEGTLFLEDTPGTLYQTPTRYPDLFTDVSELRYEYVRGDTNVVPGDATYESSQNTNRLDLASCLHLLKTVEGVIDRDPTEYITKGKAEYATKPNTPKSQGKVEPNHGPKTKSNKPPPALQTAPQQIAKSQAAPTNRHNRGGGLVEPRGSSVLSGKAPAPEKVWRGRGRCVPLGRGGRSGGR